MKRDPSARIDLPDWICGGPGQLAIAEAKGSHQSASLSQGTRPGPIRTASKQIQSVRGQVSRMRAGTTRWIDRSVKGWAVMSRWGVEQPPRDPYVFVRDPEMRGEPLSEEEIPTLILPVAREHVRQTLEGLGYGDIIGEHGQDTAGHPLRDRQEVLHFLSERLHHLACICNE
jgi:hypothetical protein